MLGVVVRIMGGLFSVGATLRRAPWPSSRRVGASRERRIAAGACRSGAGRERCASMRRAVLCLALAACAGCAVPRPFGEGASLHKVVSGGYQALDHEVFDGHPVYGLGFVTRDDRNGW